ncbi:MAG: twin-arginine translocase subunit TatC [Proteobacteria bacterium]|nr:twin-arginine translocase subunit TatC [Pseudomonadota bacterium]
MNKQVPSKDVATPDDPDNHTMPLLDHLMELRKRLLYSVVALLIAFFGGMAVSQHIYNFLMQPYADAMHQHGGTQRMIYTHLAEGFLVELKVGFFAAIFVTFPIFANQMWAFVAPGLYKHEKRAILPFLLASPILFVMGAALVYYMIMPLAWKFLLGFQTTAAETALPIQLEAAIGDYLSLVMTLILAFGIAFQMPVLLVLLARVGIISSKALKEKRRYAIIGVFVFAAVVTPPDVVSQLGLALPMLLLYEISIIFAKMVEKKPEDIVADGSEAGGGDTDFNDA